MRIVPCAGEPTRFHVESNSLECLGCGRLIGRSKPHGQLCAKCGGQLDVRFHLVDVAAFSLNGQCSCEHFCFNLQPKVRAVPPKEQAAGRWRCSHIDAARQFALDRTLRQHETERYRGAGRQREEAAP